MLDVSKVKINLGGVRDVCNQSGVLTLLQSEADKVKDRADGMMSKPTARGGAPHHRTIVGRTKHNIQEVSIYTYSTEAKKQQRDNDTLTKALTGG